MQIASPYAYCGIDSPDCACSEKKKDEMPLEERNKKKMAAVEATREHGNILFKEGKYEQALSVYDRVSFLLSLYLLLID